MNFIQYRIQPPVNMDIVFEFYKNKRSELTPLSYTPKIIFYRDYTHDDFVEWKFETEEERDCCYTWLCKRLATDITTEVGYLIDEMKKK